ncbi:cerato-platanin-like protein [Fomitiporia mediterranea MF3/22]|uniref:cerato-platanin-like protein n=1 Tax=Fomitiporia mediterranea (strain MF3/22) TaxID=694068 RepID=UPI0004407F29|nr:cerato-platanin-like protein [Fomitiporia mediterranea MF3/22]EJC99995.1 cerato-platanin-like protein [Fomitiporia mediterranea MF3/22]
MQLTAIFSTLLLAGSAFAVKATYDQTYDNASGSMNGVACSNGANGLASRFPTFGDLPTFPNVGGAHAVTGWNSTKCGSCWKLTYQGTSITLTAIDTAGVGFNIALEALDTLTDGHGQEWGSADVTAVEDATRSFSPSSSHWYNGLWDSA